MKLTLNLKVLNENVYVQFKGNHMCRKIIKWHKFITAEARNKKKKRKNQQTYNVAQALFGEFTVEVSLCMNCLHVSAHFGPTNKSKVATCRGVRCQKSVFHSCLWIRDFKTRKWPILALVMAQIQALPTWARPRRQLKPFQDKATLLNNF